ncbi:MAG: alpha/beta hydrolase [bacterium]|nr:alpha/beta hydrolase [bacterium]
MRRILIVAALLAMASVCHAGSHFTGRVASADGVEIAYETWGTGNRAVVLVHGWSCDRTYWRDQVDHLAKSWKVVAVDLAGHGESGVTRTDYSMEAFGADVVAVLHEQGITDAILVGHSMGGPVVVEAALQAADRVRGLVGIDNFQSMTEELPPEQIAAFLGAMEANFAGTVEFWVRSMFPADSDPELMNTVATDMAAAPPEAALSAIRSTLAWMGGGGVPQLKRLAVNLVCVNSDLHPIDLEGNRAIVPGFTATVIEGTGHFLMRGKPAEFNDLLDEALASFDAAAPTAPGSVRVE